MAKQPKYWLCLLFLLPLLIILYYIFTNFVVFVTVELDNENTTRQSCTTKECITAAATLVQNMNEKAKPCDDFGEFVCGNYKFHHNLLDGEDYNTVGSAMTQTLDNKIKMLLEAPTSSTDKPWHTLAKSYYQKCIDRSAFEATGREAILALLDEIGGWPMLNPQSKVFDTSWEEYVAAIHQKYNVPIFFNWFLFNRDKSEWELWLFPDFVKISPETREELTQFLKANNSRFTSEWDFLSRGLLKTYQDLVSSLGEDFDKQQVGPLRLMKEEYPNFDLEKYVHRLFDGIHSVPPNMTIKIFNPSYFKKIHTLTANKRDIANVAGLYVALHLRQQPYKKYLEDPNFDKIKEECVISTKQIFVAPVAQMYVREFVNPDVVFPKIKAMLALLKENLREMVNEATWLDDFTRKNAIKKIDAMSSTIGYPDSLFNDTLMHENWNISTTPTENFYTLFVRVMQKHTASRFAMLKNPSNWLDRLINSVEAYYSLQSNGMLIASPMMEHPYFQLNVPDYVNYPAIGHVLAHELMHGFDNKGRLFDENGLETNWWSNETSAQYEEKSKCFVNLYDEHGVDGRLTLHENIADNVGLQLVYRAYKRLKAMKPDAIEAVLPGFEKYTVDQMFFILFTSKFCDVMKDGPLHNPYETHSRPLLRGLVTMKNLNEFSEAFGCLKTDKMNRKDKCTIW